MSRSLKGLRIVITRSPSQSSSFRQRLQRAGATVLEVPAIEIRPRSGEEIDEAIAHLSRYDWLFFTSANGVRIFFQRVRKLNYFPDAGECPRICAIGPATAAAVEAEGLHVDLIPRVYQAEGVLEDFNRTHQGQIQGLRILLPRASQAREILPRRLGEQGAAVDVIPIYDTVIPEGSTDRLRQALGDAPPDLVTFTSSSTVHNFISLAGGREALRGLRCAVIGPITASTAQEYGLNVVVQPRQSTIPALFEAIEDYFRSARGS